MENETNDDRMTVLDMAVSCMDGGIASGRESAEESELLTYSDEIIQKFRKSFGVKPEETLGNSDAWNETDEHILEAYKDAEYELLLYAWGHIKVLMLECGIGDSVNEVLTKEIVKKFGAKNK